MCVYVVHYLKCCFNLGLLSQLFYMLYLFLVIIMFYNFINKLSIILAKTDIPFSTKIYR